MRNRILLIALVVGVVAGLGVAGTSQAASFTFQLGDIVAGTGNGQYKVFDPTGNLLTTLDTTSGSSEDTGGAFDASGNLYVTNWTANSVSVFDVHGNLINPSFGPVNTFNTHPESVTISSSGNIYVGQADGNKQVLQFNSAGTLLNSYSPTTQDRGTDWIDLGPDQKTLYYTSEGTSIMRFDVSTGTQLADFATGLPGSSAYALRVLANGDVLVADTDRALLLDPNGNIIRTYTDPKLTDAFALNVLPDGLSFLTGNINSTGEIFQFNIATGALEQTIFPSPSVDLAGLIVFGELGVGPPPNVPEPGSLLLLGSGLAGLAGIGWRRMRQ